MQDIKFSSWWCFDVTHPKSGRKFKEGFLLNNCFVLPLVFSKPSSPALRRGVKCYFVVWTQEFLLKTKIGLNIFFENQSFSGLNFAFHDLFWKIHNTSKKVTFWQTAFPNHNKGIKNKHSKKYWISFFGCKPNPK